MKKNTKQTLKILSSVGIVLLILILSVLITISTFDPAVGWLCSHLFNSCTGAPVLAFIVIPVAVAASFLGSISILIIVWVVINFVIKRMRK